MTILFFPNQESKLKQISSNLFLKDLFISRSSSCANNRRSFSLRCTCECIRAWNLSVKISFLAFWRGNGCFQNQDEISSFPRILHGCVMFVGRMNVPFITSCRLHVDPKLCLKKSNFSSDVARVSANPSSSELHQSPWLSARRFSARTSFEKVGFENDRNGRGAGGGDVGDNMARGSSESFIHCHYVES